MAILQWLAHSPARWEAITSQIALAFMSESSQKRMFSFLLQEERERGREE